MELDSLRPYTFTITGFNSVPSAIVDELIACQHPTNGFSSTVKMEADYAFDASMDDSISLETRQLLTMALNRFPETEEFEFNC